MMDTGMLREMLRCTPNTEALHVVMPDKVSRIVTQDGGTEMLTGVCDYCEQQVFSWHESLVDTRVRHLVAEQQYLWFALPGGRFVIEEIPAQAM